MTVYSKAYKFRIFPNKSQKKFFKQSFGCSRFVYNHFLDKIKSLSKTNLKSIKVNQFKNELKYLKQDYEWLKVIDSISLQASIEDLNDAMLRFFKKQNRFPRFKSKKNPVKSYTTKMVNNNIQIKNNKIRLPKIGWIRFAKSREIPSDAMIKRVTVRKNGSGKFFVSINVQESMEEFPKTESIIGVDMGLEYFITDSFGNKINNERYFRSLERKLIKEQRKLSRKKHGSSNWYKQKCKVASVHEKIANKRMDFQHKMSTDIVKNHDVIGIEDLSISNMLKNKRLSKSIQDASWSEFATMLVYKAEWYGKQLIKVGKTFPSSQLCSSCGEKNSKTKDLKVRDWICKHCHTPHDKDINAAINIKNEAERLLSEKKAA